MRTGRSSLGRCANRLFRAPGNSPAVMVPFRALRPLDLLRAVGPFRALEFRAMELRPVLMVLHVLLLAVVPFVFPVGLMVVRVFPVVLVVLLLLVLVIMLYMLAVIVPVGIVVTIVMLG